jgi:hypothetical protein
MKNKPLLLLLTFFTTVSITSIAQDRDYSDCIVKESSTWGSVCEKCEYYKEGFKRSYEETFTVTFRNACREQVELKVAMQESNGTWRIFPVRMLMQDERFEAYACKGSGKYLYWVKRVDDTEIILPSDREIVSEYTEY